MICSSIKHLGFDILKFIFYQEQGYSSDFDLYLNKQFKL